jgi:hypothetical protein
LRAEIKALKSFLTKVLHKASEMNTLSESDDHNATSNGVGLIAPPSETIDGQMIDALKEAVQVLTDDRARLTEQVL